MTATTTEAAPVAASDRAQLAADKRRRTQLMARLESAEAAGKALRRERAESLATGDGDNAEQLQEFDASIAANDATAQGWRDALEVLDARITDASERVRLADLAAQERALDDMLTARDAALENGAAFARSAEQELSRLDAALSANASGLRSINREIARLGGAPVDPSEMAARANTAELRAAIASLREYVAATEAE